MPGHIPAERLAVFTSNSKFLNFFIPTINITDRFSVIVRNLLIMKWQFNVSEGSKNLNLKAEVVYTSYQIEEVKVTGEGISLLLQNNRPLLEAIELKQPLRWRIISGEVKDQVLLAKIKKEAENYLTNPGSRAGEEAVKKHAKA